MRKAHVTDNSDLSLQSVVVLETQPAPKSETASSIKLISDLHSHVYIYSHSATSFAHQLKTCTTIKRTSHPPHIVCVPILIS